MIKNLHDITIPLHKEFFEQGEGVMKNILGRIFVFVFIIVCSKTFALSSDVSNECKLYITSDQLVLSDYGIFVLLENADGYLSKILVPQVNWDENGLFVAREYLPDPQAAWCRNGHKACDRCYRCNVRSCPAYGCRCK